MQKNTQAQWSNQKQTVIKRLELRLSEATKRVLGSQEEWEKFLAVSSRFIKYPFHQQIQIYDQRPDATAVADNKIREERLGLRYKPGTHGFQVIDKRDKDNPVVRRYHDIADVREHRKDSKIPKLFTFPLEYTGEVVNRIAGMGREKESPEVSLWKWIGEKTEIYYAEELLETLSDKGLALQVESQNNVDDDQKAEALRKYMQAMVSFQVFSRCGLNIQLCKNMNRELLEGNLYGRSVLAASTEETVGFFGDTVSLASESVFNIISNACEVVSKEITTEKNISQNKESVQDNPETSKEISKEPEREEPSHILSNPLTDQPITREGNTITIGRGDSYHEIDVELLEDMLEALPTTVRIDGHPCAKVDEWTDSDGYSYVLGTSVEDASFSYLAVGGESFEFDYLPTREDQTRCFFWFRPGIRGLQ